MRIEIFGCAFTACRIFASPSTSKSSTRRRTFTPLFAAKSKRSIAINPTLSAENIKYCISILLVALSVSQPRAVNAPAPSSNKCMPVFPASRGSVKRFQTSFKREGGIGSIASQKGLSGLN